MSGHALVGLWKTIRTLTAAGVEEDNYKYVIVWNL